MKVVGDIMLFRMKYVPPSISAWKCPKWIDLCSRGNLRFLKSYCSLNMYIWHNIFDFFMTQMRISNSMMPLKFTPTFPYIIDQKRTCFPEMSRDFQKLQNVPNMIISTCLRFPI